MTLFINGKWVEGLGAEVQSISPYTGKILWSGRSATLEHVTASVHAAADAFQDWSMRSLNDRLNIIKAYGDQLQQNKQELATLIALEAGKTDWDAAGEATAMINKIDISVTAYHERTGSKEAINGAMRSKLAHRPHGVMAVFGPYNFPGHLPNGHMVPALLAGNTVVFKPSDQTPAVAEFMVKCWQKAGLPAGVVNLIHGGKDVGMALTAQPDINGVLFTGSAAAGIAINKAMADRPEVIVALEMGGNNPLIVHDVQDLTAAAIMTVNSAFISSGQRCTCARRLIVPMGPAGDAFITELTAVMDRLHIDQFGADTPAFMGPVVSAAAAQMVLQAQEDIIAKGGVALRRCLPIDDLGPAFITPGLIDVTGANAIADEEIFGPLLQLIRVPDFDAAIQVANATKYGLASGLISDNRALYDTYYPRARAGIVNWNQQLTGAASTAPFGGLGHSGNHRPSAYYAADYCAYGVATIENADGKVTAAAPIGLKE